MPNTYSQIYLQFVFAAKSRQCLIPREHKDELHQYITGWFKEEIQKCLLSIACQITLHRSLLQQRLSNSIVDQFGACIIPSCKRPYDETMTLDDIWLDMPLLDKTNADTRMTYQLASQSISNSFHLSYLEKHVQLEIFIFHYYE